MGGGPTRKICVTRALSAVAVVAVLSVPLAGLASDGTIHFTGAITTSSCDISVNGTGASDGTVALPVVDVTALGSALAQQDGAGGTFFNIAVSGCAPTQVAVYFEAGSNVDPVTHSLINTGTSNVALKLYEAAGSSVVGSQISIGTDGSGQTLDGAGTGHFYAGYALTADGEATPGTVSTSVTYSLVYQ
jgi:major type 1 subunit fimbrin (pilin)